MTYTTAKKVWRTLGKDAYSKVRSEVVGTGSGITSSWNFAHDNVIFDSLTLYTGSTAVTSSAYTTDLDEGEVTFAPESGSVISADYDYADMPDSIIQQMLSSSDNQIEIELGRTFSLTTASTQYLDVEKEQRTFFTKNYPVVNLTVSCNTASLTDPASWSSSTQGLGNDYLANAEDKLIGRIRFIDNFPEVGEDRIKIDYDYGYSSVPSTIEELAILITMRQMINSSVYKAIFKGQDNFTPVRLAEIDARIEALKRIHRKQEICLV
mgnify:CR=1 FL=1